MTQQYNNNRNQDLPAGQPRYQGGKPYQRPGGQQNKGRGFNPNRKYKKRPMITVTRGLMRWKRSQDINLQFVEICKEKFKEPGMFEKIMKLAKARVDANAKTRQSPETSGEILRAIKKDIWDSQSGG